MCKPLVAILAWILVEAFMQIVATLLMNPLGFGELDSGVDSGITIGNTTVPGVDPMIRVHTNIKDLLQCLFYLLLGCIYSARSASVRAKTVHNSNITTGSEESLTTYAWSGLMPTIRMGDSLNAAQVAGFWMPFLAFVVARFMALLIGYIPGIPGGTPTLVVQLGLGLVFAGWRRAFRERLYAPEEHFCTDWLCFAFCCCVAVAEDAHAIDGSVGVCMTCDLSLQIVGEPVNTCE